MSKRKRWSGGAFGAPREEEWEVESDDLDEAGDEGRDAPPRPRAPITLLYHDADLFVVDKPAGTPIEAGFEDAPSVFEQLPGGERAAGGGGSLHVVFPLDPEAGGLLLLTTDAEKAERLRQGLGDDSAEMGQLAIVRGRIGSPSGTINRPVAPRLAERPARIDERHGRPATTDWRLRDGFVGFLLLECRPRTAVAGQVRVHLADGGMPLAVDPAYGGAPDLRLSSFKAGYHPSRRRPERPLIARLTLHAATLRLRHPRTGEELKFESPLPKDFRAALYQLNKYGRLPPGPG